MRGEILKPQILEKNELLQRLDQAVNELGRFEIFKAGAPPGAITPEAQQTAFEFAVAYGGCLQAGLEMESEPYFPAEILGSVALAASAQLYEEVVRLEKLLSRWTLLSTKSRRERAGEIYTQFTRIALAYKTIGIALIQYHQLILENVPAGKGIFRAGEHPVIKEGVRAETAYKRACCLMLAQGQWVHKFIGFERWQVMKEFLKEK